MNDLIEALQIFSKYGNPDYPTHCEHEELTISAEIDPDDVPYDDRIRLEKLGFFVSYIDGDDCGVSIFKSFRFGSC
jgi:hypothetical protein